MFTSKSQYHLASYFFLLIYRISVRYGNEWAPVRPSGVSTLVKRYIILQENDYLTNVHISVGDVGVFRNVIIDMELQTNTEIYGDLDKTDEMKQYYTFTVPRAKAYFSGDISTSGEVSFVTGLTLSADICSGNVLDLPISMLLCASNGPVLGRCCQHRTSTYLVLAPNGLFTGMLDLLWCFGYI